ncbi:hypothetical protein l11_14250 [Neisseria weaveri LMG 5135]|nr:hypothetical protein l11_14250 [Neisseria weaveri LMG 5135]
MLGNIRGRLKKDFQTASTASCWYEMDSEGFGNNFTSKFIKIRNGYLWI